MIPVFFISREVLMPLTTLAKGHAPLRAIIPACLSGTHPHIHTARLSPGPILLHILSLLPQMGFAYRLTPGWGFYARRG